MDSAADLFQEQGYGGTTMGDIRLAAMVTGGALHHHYQTKKALTLAVIKERIARSVREGWIEPVANAKSARAGIKNVLDTIIGDLGERGGVRGCPLNNLALELSLVDVDFRREIETIFDEWRHCLADKIRKDGAVSKTRAARLAAFAISTYSGAMTMAKSRQDAAPLRDIRDDLLRMF